MGTESTGGGVIKGKIRVLLDSIGAGTGDRRDPNEPISITFESRSISGRRNTASQRRKLHPSNTA